MHCTYLLSLSLCVVGPFYIVSYDICYEKVYLELNKENLRLNATREEDEATPFRIVLTEAKEQNEFSIVYEKYSFVQSSGETAEPRQLEVSPSARMESGQSKPSTQLERKAHSTWYYLCTPQTMRGTSSSAPSFRLRSKTKDCQFILRSPLHSKGAPAEHLDSWLSGHKEYFIQCSGQRYQKNGYLGVRADRQNSDKNRIAYVPTCCSSRNTGDHHSMIFKLLPVRCRDRPKAI